MLLHFDVECFNSLAFVTIDEGLVPRATSSDIQAFVRGAQKQLSDNIPHHEGTIYFRDKLRERAAQATDILARYISGSDVFFGRSQTENILEPIREFFNNEQWPTSYLAIVTPRTKWKKADLHNTLYHLSASDGHLPCFLLEYDPGIYETLDPLPPTDLLRDASVSPKFIFWSPNGQACCVPENLGRDVYNFLLDAGSNQESVKDIIASFSKPRLRAHTLLHLSDLHFGRQEAADHELYLQTQIEALVPQIDRIVITGDLCDSPDQSYFSAFCNFRKRLERLGKEVIVIPGNHDQRVGGTALARWGRRFRQVAELEWSSIVVDDEMRAVFFCFDSSLEGNIARGRVTDQALMSVATDFAIRCRHDPEIEKYFRLALVHHHPFAYETHQGALQTFLSKFSLNDDLYLRLENAEQFVDWCERQKVEVIMHGHKHIPKWFTKRDGSISAVGCGTSMGIGELDLSYVLVSIDSRTRAFGVKFYGGRRDGSGFTEQAMAVKLV
jgi:UDP-2,3-diacylglucosamine pyrophosphatase LpxH